MMRLFLRSALAVLLLVLAGIPAAFAQTSTRVRPDQLPAFTAPAYNNVSGSELLMAWQSGVLRQITSSDFRTWILGNAIFTNAGNVGIGTASPSTKLHIKGASPTLTIESTSSWAGAYLQGNGTNPAYIFLGNTTNAEQARISVNDGGLFDIGTTNAALVRLRVATGVQIFGSGGAAPTGGDKGVGTLNVSGGYYLNGVALGAGQAATGAVNLKITNGGTPNSQIAVTADQVVASNGSAIALGTSLSLTISTGSSGANGLDTGSVAASTWYAVYAINNGTTWAGLISTSASAPTMPGGYTFKVRLGWVRTDGSSNLLRTLQLGREARYVVTASTNTAALPQIATGTVGSITTPTYVSASVSNFVPTTAHSIVLGLNVNGANAHALAAPNAAYGTDTGSNPPPLSCISVGGMTCQGRFLLESTSIYWASNASAAVYAYGWADNF